MDISISKHPTCETSLNTESVRYSIHGFNLRMIFNRQFALSFPDPLIGQNFNQGQRSGPLTLQREILNMISHAHPYLTNDVWSRPVVKRQMGHLKRSFADEGTVIYWTLSRRGSRFSIWDLPLIAQLHVPDPVPHITILVSIPNTTVQATVSAATTTLFSDFCPLLCLRSSRRENKRDPTNYGFLTWNRRNFRLNCQFSTFHVTIRLDKWLIRLPHARSLFLVKQDHLFLVTQDFAFCRPDNFTSNSTVDGH